MIRNLICFILRLALRIFFRRIEINSAEGIPIDGPVIFVLNHPNGLVDPVFLLCLSGRRVSFLAKAPLFKMPVIGFLVRALNALPVYRHQDAGADTSRNKETFAAAKDLLINGGAIAICPEGVSHDEPRLKPIKSGAARIALGAASLARDMKLRIVPVGLYYTAKTTFRSSALLYFGKSFAVEHVELEDGEPPRLAVQELSDKIELALRQVMLHAEHEEALSMVDKAERIFTSELPGDDEHHSLQRELELRKRFLEGYSLLRAKDPLRLEAFIERIRRFDQQLTRLDLEPDEIERPGPAFATVFRLAFESLLFLLAMPFALAGAIIHYPAYRLAGVSSKTIAKDSDDVVSTIKIIAAMLFFPITWIVVASAICVAFGWRWAIVTLLAAPLSGYTSMKFVEEIDQRFASVRSLAFYLTRRRFFLRMINERRLIYGEIVRLGAEVAALVDRKPAVDLQAELQ